MLTQRMLSCGRTYHAGQAEQFTRIARIRLHQYQQLNSAQDDSTPDGANMSNLTEFELPPDPHAQHLAMMVRQAFESVISSEELPRPRSQTGSLQEHQLRGTDTNDLVTAEPNISMSRNAARKLLKINLHYAPLNHAVN